MAELYGATAALVAGEFPGVDLTSLATQIAEWFRLYGALAGTALRRQGYDPATISGLGDADDLCIIARHYLIKSTGAEVAAALTLQGRELDAVAFREQAAAALEELTRTSPEVISQSWDRNEQQGATRIDATMTGTAPARVARRFRRGMST